MEHARSLSHREPERTSLETRPTKYDPFITLAAAGLAALVDPLTPATFLDEYWDKQSIHLTGNQRNGGASLVSDLGFDVRELRQAAARLPAGGVRARFRSRATGEDRQIEATADQIEPLFDGGLSIQLVHLQRAHAGVALLLGRLRAELQLAGHISCDAHLSSACTGQPSHFERDPVMYLQLAGSQTWSYGRGPVLPYPPAGLAAIDWAVEAYQQRHPWARVPGPKDEKLRTSLLRPGDVLYLPSGTWHEALASDQSLALAIAFRSAPLHRLVATALEEALAPFAQWRWSPRDGLPDAERMAGHLREVVGRFGGDALAALCRPAGLGGGEALLPDERLEAPKPLRHQVVVDEASGASDLLVMAGGRSVGLPLEMMLLVSRLAGSSGFSPGEAMSWPGVAAAYSAREVRRSLTALLAGGLLRRVQLPI
jgi:ribosomal protein L16 Arg81 hydroxylase